jgi:hypothetical protein
MRVSGVELPEQTLIAPDAAGGDLRAEKSYQLFLVDDRAAQNTVRLIE